ncbi:MAG: isoprenylcysteine carboxylmethyltransferase family protein [Anaerolineales bacterium]|jgi:protein-S-isoprenylcysteine O-methyltransferase Ste14
MLGPALILLAVAAYGALHSLLASQAAKEGVEHVLGRITSRYYRLAYNLLGLATLLPLLALPILLPDHGLYAIPFPWVLLTLSGQLAAVGMVLLAIGQTDPWGFLGVRQLLEGENRSPGQLVETGLYRWVRHPVYSAGLLFIWLLPRMSANLLALNVGLTAYLWLGTLFEERKLVHEFGQAYVAYRHRVPRLIPRPRRSRQESPR